MSSRATGARRALVASSAAAVVLGLALALAGCDSSGEDASGLSSTAATPTPTAPATTDGEARAVQVFLVRGERVAPVERRVEGPAVLRGALEALLQGPSAEDEAAGLGTAIAQGVELRGVLLSAGTATIDLSGPLGEPAGSLPAYLRVAQLVHTATQFPTVERVALRLDGEPVTALAASTLTRADVGPSAPAILVDTPRPGATVTSPLRVRGTADTFEATVDWQLVAADGAVLAEGVTTASCGTGCRGRFAFAQAVTGSGPATLRLFERSAKDGSETKVVEVPVVLAAP